MAFSQGLAGLGWRQGENVRVEYRWSASNSELIRQYAKELVALAPDVNSRQWHASSRGTEKNHQFDSDRLRAGTGSGSPWPREKPVASGGQNYRLHFRQSGTDRKVDWTSQGRKAAHHPSGADVQSKDHSFFLTRLID